MRRTPATAMSERWQRRQRQPASRAKYKQCWQETAAVTMVGRQAARRNGWTGGARTSLKVFGEEAVCVRARPAEGYQQRQTNGVLMTGSPRTRK